MGPQPAAAEVVAAGVGETVTVLTEVVFVTVAKVVEEELVMVMKVEVEDEVALEDVTALDDELDLLVVMGLTGVVEVM